MRLATIFCGFMLLVAAVAPAAAADRAAFRFTQPPGPRAVGLKVVEQYDRSRGYQPAIDALGKPYAGERARPLQTLIWYPAQATGRPAMHYADYVKLLETEVSFGHPRDIAEDHIPRPLSAADLAAPTRAVRDALPAAGRFPVVIYSPGAWQPGWENLDLCEYLASHGYVVLATPSVGVSARKITIDLPGAEVAAQDISFLIGYAASLPDADTSQIATIGHSWGGVAETFAAAHDNRIKALIQLDGSIRYYPNLLKQGGIDVEKLQLPMLYFLQRNMSLEVWDGTSLAQRAEPDPLNHWQTGDLFMVHLLGLYHPIFNSVMQRQTDIPATYGAVPFYLGDYSQDEQMASYGWMARYSLAFLDHVLKQRPEGLAFLERSPAANGVPPHLVDSAYQPATATPPTAGAFRQEVGRVGFDHAAQALAAFRSKHPDFMIDEASMRFWSGELIADGHAREAAAVLRLNVAMHPKSAEAATALARFGKR